jgi:hypothetical protein
MNSLNIAVQIRSLRAQLEVLEASLGTWRAAKRHTLADLKGMLQKESRTSAEEIDKAKYCGGRKYN